MNVVVKLTISCEDTFQEMLVIRGMSDDAANDIIEAWLAENDTNEFEIAASQYAHVGVSITDDCFVIVSMDDSVADMVERLLESKHFGTGILREIFDR